MLTSPYEVIDEIKANRIEMEKVCMLERKTMAELEDILVDFALYYGEKDLLPIKRPNAFWAFHRWVRNQRRFDRNNSDNNPLGKFVM